MLRMYTCAYCSKKFQREAWYKKHQCTAKKRFAQLHNMDVLFAYELFNHWCKRSGFTRRGKDRSHDDFVRSPFYGTFIKLVKFSQDNFLVSTQIYLDYLVDERIMEKDWFAQWVLEQYRDWYRKRENHEDQVRVSVRTIRAWSEENGVAPKDFFRMVGPGDAMDMILTNRLMPWAVLGYDRGLTDLMPRLDEEKMAKLDRFLNGRYWRDKIVGDDDTRQIVQQMLEQEFGA
jgi:hypothetical protein